MSLVYVVIRQVLISHDGGPMGPMRLSAAEEPKVNTVSYPPVGRSDVRLPSGESGRLWPNGCREAASSIAIWLKGLAKPGWSRRVFTIPA